MLIKLWAQQATRYDICTDQMISGVWRLCLRLRWPFDKAWVLESKTDESEVQGGQGR